MEQNISWEAGSPSASQEIPHLFWNLKVQYCIHKEVSSLQYLWWKFCVHFSSLPCVSINF
jgi:hypothetical protein